MKRIEIVQVHRHEEKAGFTLVELLIVMVIVAILAAVALPMYSAYIARACQSTIQQHLLAMWQAQEMYRFQNGTYQTSPALLPGWVATKNAGSGKFYNLVFNNPAAPTNTTFTFRATGNIDGDATNDVWTIDQDGTLINVTNDVNS